MPRDRIIGALEDTEWNAPRLRRIDGRYGAPRT